MRRVYGIWFVRQIAPALFLQVPLFVFIFLREISREFFIAEIMQNTALAMQNKHNATATLWQFFSNGLQHATIPLLIISTSAIIVAMLTLKIVSNLRTIFRHTLSHPLQQHGSMR